MVARREIPPPVIDSAKVFAFAYNDESMEATDRLHLLVGGEDGMERLGEVSRIAICASYNIPGDILLLFCNAE